MDVARHHPSGLCVSGAVFRVFHATGRCSALASPPAFKNLGRGVF